MVNAIGREYVYTVHSQTNVTVRTLLVQDTKQFSESNNIKVLIASPSFGTGFSIDAGYIDYTAAFMFTFPTTAHDNVQHIARARESAAVFVWSERGSPNNQTMLSKNLFVRRKYDDIIKSIDNTATIAQVVGAIDKSSELWQQYYITKTAEAELSVTPEWFSYIPCWTPCWHCQDCYRLASYVTFNFR
jgi:hypothetical protein